MGMLSQTKSLPRRFSDEKFKDWNSFWYTLAFGKQTFYSQVDLNEPSAYEYATHAIAMNCLDIDAQEGIKAFLEKRAPLWKNR